MEKSQLDYAGFFAYSKEEGTIAAKYEQCDPKDTKRRLKEIQKIQNNIMKEKNKKLVGKVIKVISDGIDYDTQSFIGRSEYQAPDIDGVIYFASDELVEEGKTYNVEITSYKGSYLFGRTVQ